MHNLNFKLDSMSCDRRIHFFKSLKFFTSFTKFTTTMPHDDHIASLIQCIQSHGNDNEE